MSDDQSRVVQADERDEEAYARGDSGVEFVRYAAQDHLTNSERSEHQENHSGKKYGSERCLPGNTHSDDNGVSEICIETHAGSESDGVTSEGSHENASDCRGEAGCGGDGRKGQTCLTEDRGVNQNDIRHGYESRQSGKQLGAPAGAKALEFKVAFESKSHAESKIEKHSSGHKASANHGLRRLCVRKRTELVAICDELTARWGSY